ncbi:MAG: hypothetical protein ACR2RF_18760 [Geminicoccaceae bacterium]
MAGVKGKSGPAKGNTNALKHGFYVSALMPGEEEIFEAAKTLPIDNEIALLRVMALRAAKFQAEGGELTAATQVVFNTHMGRLRDFMMAKSIMLRNERESGANVDEDLDRTIDVLERTGAHRATFKANGKTNGKVTNGNGTG